jgi:hypothetical protein
MKYVYFFIVEIYYLILFVISGLFSFSGLIGGLSENSNIVIILFVLFASIISFYNEIVLLKGKPIKSSLFNVFIITKVLLIATYVYGVILAAKDEYGFGGFFVLYLFLPLEVIAIGRLISFLRKTSPVSVNPNS